MKGFRSRISRIAIPFFFILFGTLILGIIPVFIVILKYDPELSNAYVAFGTLTLALATGVLAFFTWWSIRNSNEKEKRERKERLLNEIIEWATEIAEWNIDTSYKAKKELKESKEPLWVILLQLFRLAEGFRKMKRRGELTIQQLTSILNSKSLTQAIDVLLKELQNQIELGGLHEIALMKDINIESQTLSDEFNSAEERVIKHRKLLNKTAEKVIEEAIKMKLEI